MANYYAHPGSIFFLAIFFPVLATIAVALRFYARRKANLGYWIDDWLIIPPILILWTMAGLAIWGVTTGVLGELLPKPSVPGPKGYFFSDSPEQMRVVKIKVLYDDLSVWLLGCVKLSILFFFRSVFGSKGRFPSKFNTITLIAIIIVILWTLTFGLGLIFDCRLHPEDAWKPLYEVVRDCPHVNQLLEAYAITDFLTDLMIWLLPIPKILGLHLALKRKLAILSVFMVGLVAIGASAARLGVFVEFVIYSYSNANGEEVMSYLVFWFLIESGLCIIVACMPTLNIVFRKVNFNSIIERIWSSISLRSLRSRSGHNASTVEQRADSEAPQSDQLPISKAISESFVLTTIDSTSGQLTYSRSLDPESGTQTFTKS